MRFLLLLALLPSIARADYGVWGERGVPRRLAMAGALVVAADGRGVSVFDPSDPAKIRRVASAATTSESLDVGIAGDRIDVLTRTGVEHFTLLPGGTLRPDGTTEVEGGLRVASQVGSFAVGRADSFLIFNRDGSLRLNGRTNRPVQALLYDRQHLLVSVEKEGVTIYRPDGGLAAILPIDARQMVAHEHSLFAAAWEQGLVQVDLSRLESPGAPRFFGEGDVFHSLTVSEGRLAASGPAGRILLFSLANGSPLIATVNEKADVLIASGNHLYTSFTNIDSWGIVRETGTPLRAFEVTAGGLSLAGEFHDLAGPVSGVATDGTFAYVADPPFFRVIDVSTPSRAREVASIEVPDLEERVRIRGERAIVYGGGDVQMIDIGDPYAPKFLGVFASTGHPPSIASFARETVVEGNPHSGFHVIDFTSNPARPTIMSHLIWHWWDVVAHEDVAYIFDLTGFKVVDISNRLQTRDVRGIQNVGSLQAEIAPRTASHPDLLLVYTREGLRVYTMEEPLNPRWIGTASVPQGGTLSVSGDTAFLVSPSGSVRIDLSQPTRPVTTPASIPVKAPLQSSSAGEKVVVADRYGLKISGPVTTAPGPPPTPGKDPSRRRPSRG